MTKGKKKLSNFNPKADRDVPFDLFRNKATRQKYLDKKYGDEK